MTCKNCNTEANSNYCPNCGQPAMLPRINGHYIMHEIEHIIHFERGILYSVKELCLRPGLTIRNFINENRSRLVKPIIFIILTSLIYTLVAHFFHVEYEFVHFSGVEHLAIGKILKWNQEHYGYANILTGGFIAFWLKMFQRKYHYNFFEILIMLCYVIGMQMLIFSLFSIINVIVHIKLETFAGVVGLLYLVWAAGDFFEEKKISNYTKVLTSYFLGIISFYTVILGLGMILEVVIDR